MQKILISVLIILGLHTQNIQSAVYFHLLHGFEVGYKFSLMNSSNLDNLINKYNSNELRQTWDDGDHQYMENFNYMNGYYLRYNLYKYLDKRDNPMSSYQFSGEFTRSYASSESFFIDNHFETAYRNYNFTHSSLMVDFTYGFSYFRNLLTYLELGIGFDTFSIESKLIAPENISYDDLLEFENTTFTTNTDSTRMQNGVYKGNGYSIKLEFKNEYFFTNNFTADFGLGLKFVDIGELWKGNEYFRKSQEENEEFLYKGFDFSVKFGFGYYFRLQ